MVYNIMHDVHPDLPYAQYTIGHFVSVRDYYEYPLANFTSILVIREETHFCSENCCAESAVFTILS